MIYIHTNQCKACRTWHDAFAAALRARQAEFRTVDVTRGNWPQPGPDDLLLIRFNESCQRNIKPLYPLLQEQFPGRIWPDPLSVWLYDDKLRQANLFQAQRIPHPTTAWVRSPAEAAAFMDAHQLQFPIVRKQRGGSSSKQVSLLRDLIDCEFPCLLQRYLPDNSGDLRVVIIGHRLCAVRRLNRLDDWRASGSGRAEPIDSIPQDVIDVASHFCRKHNLHTLAFDFVQDRAGRWHLLEVSYAFLSGWLEQHHSFHIDLETGSRVESPVTPAAAIVDDILSGRYPL